MFQGVSPRDSDPDRDVEPISAFQRRSDAFAAALPDAMDLFQATWVEGDHPDNRNHQKKGIYWDLTW